MKASQILKNGIAALPQVLWNLTLIALGSALCAVALNGILIPRQFLSGGFTGLSLIVHYLFPAFPLGAIYFLLNIPNYAFGWKYVGRRFFLYSIAGMIIFSAAIEAIHISLPVYDYLLSALLAGVIVGIGSGLILKSLGSAGGTDILSVILLKLFSIRLGTTILAFNVMILAAAAAVVSGVERTPNARAEAVNRMPLHRVDRVLRTGVPAEEFRVVREEGDRGLELQRPGTQ